MNTNNVDWASEVQGAVLAMKDEGQKAYTFMKQEAPEVAAEYVRWQIVKGISGATPLALAAAIGFVITVKFYRTWKKNLAEIKEEYHRGEWGFGAITAGFVSFALLAGAFDVGSRAAKALIAPRIVILEGIKEVVR